MSGLDEGRRLRDEGAAVGGSRLTQLREAAGEIKPHNGTPVTAESLRWAATHEALCRSWIFDVLIGLAAAIDEPTAEEVRTWAVKR